MFVLSPTNKNVSGIFNPGWPPGSNNSGPSLGGRLNSEGCVLLDWLLFGFINPLMTRGGHICPPKRKNAEKCLR